MGCCYGVYIVDFVIGGFVVMKFLVVLRCNVYLIIVWFNLWYIFFVVDYVGIVYFVLIWNIGC